MGQKQDEDEAEGYAFPIVLKRHDKGAGSVSGSTTPGLTNGKSAGKQQILSEGDLQRADEALSQRAFSPSSFLAYNR